MHFRKLIAKYFPEQIKKYLSGKFSRYRMLYVINQFDKYRKRYSTITFKKKVKFTNRWLQEFPEQAHFNYIHVEHWLKNIVIKPASIIEIGGWRGDLALKALSSFDHIIAWHNYDLLEFNEYQKCKDTRYELITLDQYIWHKSLDHKYNALIATHMIEHICWKELIQLIGWIPREIRTVLFEAPIPPTGENISWKGDYSSHVLEKGWEQIISEMKNNDFSLDYSEDNTYIFGR